MYEFNLVLLLLQQMCVFLVIAWLMSKTRLFIPLMQVTVRLPHKLLCYVTFSIFCIMGTYFGLHIEDSIANTRAIGAVMGGLLGGPVVGGLVGLTGGLHRYSMGGMTALSCMISTIVEGLLGGLVHSVLIRRGRPDKVFSPLTAGAITCVAELVQMLIILLIARPFDDALHLVSNIAAPMMVTNTVGAALCSGVIALVMAAVARIHPRLDLLMRLITDAMLAMPHLLLLILICFTLGGGKSGVIAAVALTHWPRLALILRADAERVAQSDYLTLTYRLGHGHLYCWRYHYFPALLPQWLTGTLLMFPHAVLHSAALSFLGFGLAPHEPSLGLLLADALRFISHGNWWLVLFPGLMLFTLVMLFDQFARATQRLWLRSDVC